MPGMPGGRPRLAEIAGAAGYCRRRQPDRRRAGKFQVYRAARRAALRTRARTDRQQTQNSVLLVAVKPAVSDAVDRLEHHPAQRPFEWPAVERRAVGAATLPAEAVGDQHEATR